MDDLNDTQPNYSNAKNEACELGRSWKLNPFIKVKPGETFTLAEIQGPGTIQQTWMTPPASGT